MRKTTELSVILVNDWGCSNETTHYTTIGILETATEESIREIIVKECVSKWNFDDDEAEEFLNEVVPALYGDNEYKSEEYEIAFKMESCFLFE